MYSIWISDFEKKVNNIDNFDENWQTNLYFVNVHVCAKICASRSSRLYFVPNAFHDTLLLLLLYV